MINKKLVKYLNDNIIPLYETLDLAHRGNHVYDVIDYSLEIAKDYNLNNEMIYTIAVFHDVGLIDNRKTHHLVGAKMLFEDKFINKYFSSEEINIMKEAVEDHRASSKNEPRSIYGKIIAEADRSNDLDDIIRRSFLFGFTNKILNFSESFERIYEHITKKYGINGYMKVYLKTRRTEEMLKGLRELLKDKVGFKKYSYKIYKELVINNVVIKSYEEKHLNEMYKLFKKTILNICIKDYNLEEVDAWINNVDLNIWDKKFRKNQTILIFFEDKLIGFGDIDSNSYLDHLYVSYEFQNLGIGKMILNELIKDKIKDILTDASITSKEFFKKQGFKVIEEQKVLISNINLINNKMIKYQAK